MTHKKFTSGMLFAVVCSGVALSSFAQQEVYSPNVVGFQKLTVPSSNSGSGLFLGSTPFNRDVANLDEVLGTNGVAGSSTTGDNVVLFDKSSQTYSTYWLGSNANPALHRHWRNTSRLATNVYIEPGVGFWYRNRLNSNSILILAGEAVDDTAVTNIIVPSLQILSYPYSTSIRLADMTLTNGKAGNSYQTADNLTLYESTNQAYTSYFLNSNSVNPALHRKWRTTSALATNVYVQSGRGFWYLSRLSTNFLWVEIKPYTY